MAVIPVIFVCDCPNQKSFAETSFQVLNQVEHLNHPSVPQIVVLDSPVMIPFKLPQVVQERLRSFAKTGKKFADFYEFLGKANGYLDFLRGYDLVNGKELKEEEGRIVYGH